MGFLVSGFYYYKNVDEIFHLFVCLVDVDFTAFAHFFCVSFPLLIFLLLSYLIGKLV